MDLNLKRPLLFFDIESTGLNIVTDSIVELSFVKVFPDTHHETKTWRVCPWDYSAGVQKKMDPKASEVNGIHDEDVAPHKVCILTLSNRSGGAERLIKKHHHHDLKTLLTPTHNHHSDPRRRRAFVHGVHERGQGHHTAHQ